MPLYEYKCEGCGEVFEVMQKFSDEPVTVHDKCGAPVRRLLSAPSFQLKGSGWYATDYAKGGGSSPKSESASKTESKPSETKSTESKTPASSEKSKTD
jgi:putative FmdB family regulatory protein